MRGSGGEGDSASTAAQRITDAPARRAVTVGGAPAAGATARAPTPPCAMTPCLSRKSRTARFTSSTSVPSKSPCLPPWSGNSRLGTPARSSAACSRRACANGTTGSASPCSGEDRRRAPLGDVGDAARPARASAARRARLPIQPTAKSRACGGASSSRDVDDAEEVDHRGHLERLVAGAEPVEPGRGRRQRRHQRQVRARRAADQRPRGRRRTRTAARGGSPSGARSGCPGRRPAPSRPAPAGSRR